MKRGKYEAPRAPKHHSSKKALAMLLSLVLVIGCVVGGTVAWLTAQDTPVVNKFSPSTIGVELKEHTYDATTDTLTNKTTDTGVTDYKMIPGWTIPKDPEAWITEDSKDAYLFVKIQESENFDDFMTYAIAEGWTLLTGVTGLDESKTEEDEINTATNDTYVIYREVAAGASAAAMGDANAFHILKNDQITVIGEGITAEMMNALVADDPDTEKNESTYPTLSFTAYAHQLYESKGNKFDVATAWGNLSNQ